MLRLFKTRPFINFKIIQRNTASKHIQEENTEHQNFEVRNNFGIPLISQNLENVLFGSENRNESSPPEKILEALNHLKSFGINPKKSEPVEDSQTSFQLPPLFGNVDSHFYRIGQDYIEPYLKLIQDFESTKESLPNIPTKWEKHSGWTRYNTDGTTTSVPFPLEDVFCFDVEVCVKDGHHPVMATALTTKAWYSWCAAHLVDPSVTVNTPLRPSDLIPLGSSDKGNSRLVIGHNVSYDRARTSEEYSIKPTKTRFLDTMSLHIVVSGMTSGQRMMKQKKDSNTDEESVQKWLTETSMNNLSDVYQLYCKEGPLEKKKRDVFVEGSLDEIRDDFLNLMTYCANDVLATFKVLTVVFPQFRSRCPHPVTLASMLEMGSSYLPINTDNWDRYLRQADFVAHELEEEVERTLVQQAKETCQILVDDKHLTDLWMWDQDWKCTKLMLKKGNPPKIIEEYDPNKTELENLHIKFQGVMETSALLYKKQPKVPGYPGWYQDICERDTSGFDDPTDLGLTKAVIPKLLRLSWMGYPLHRHKVEKWGYIIPKVDSVDASHDFLDENLHPVFPVNSLLRHLEQKIEKNSQIEESSYEDNFVSEPKDKSGFKNKKKKSAKTDEGDKGIELRETPGCLFHKLPHKDGKELRVGNPLSKSFSGKVRDGVLSTESGHLAEKVLKAGKLLSYWKSSQDRISDQMVVSVSEEIPGMSAIIPHLVSAGTLTRRAVERTWLVASNAKTDRVGSELKCLVQAPDGYHLVGADVDSQELWIAAIFGDSHFVGEHGCTALGWMMLQGTKSDGTDMHSITARSVGVTRDEAKVLNYGRIYGAGVPFAKQLLKTFNPSLTNLEASKLAAKMYSETKGERFYKLNKTGALFFALNLDADAKELSKFDEKIVTSKDINVLLNIKRKMDAYFHKVKLSNKSGPEFWLNDHGVNIAYDLGLNELDTPDRMSMKSASRFLKSVSRISAQDDDNWIKETKVLASKTLWRGGSESHTFNRLEEIALDSHTKTPALGCRISRVLETEMVGEDYLPSRINWVVQSSAVDYLHLLLISMSWLTSVYSIDARFVISIHDEVRYLVKSEDRYRAGLALQISNLLVRSLFCKKLGLKSLPRDVAFFSGVDFDKVMRKDPKNECVTPSNPQGLSHGYGINLGECLSIQEIVEMTNNGSLLK